MEDLNCWESKFELCDYSKQLLDKIININKQLQQQPKIDLTKIKKAIYYAKKYHGTQKRLSGEPFYSHPLAVAEMVLDCCYITDVLETCILHDVIEDTTCTKKIISNIFGNKVANQVEALTRIKNNKKISSANMIDSLLTEKKETLLLIKFFDRLHNMQTIYIKPIEKIHAVIKETLHYFLSIGIYLSSIYKNMMKYDESLLKLCCQYINIQQEEHLDLIASFEQECSFQIVPQGFQNVLFPNSILGKLVT